MRHVVYLACLVMTGGLAADVCTAATYVVRPDGLGDYPTIQVAVVYCTDGDTVALTDGVFSGDQNRDIDFFGREITVRSQSGHPASCTIDCGGSESAPHRAFHLVSAEGPGAIITGIQMVNGWASPDGGAMLLAGSSPTVRECIFSNNFSSEGGAVCSRVASGAVFTDCVFSDNRAEYGGALMITNSADPTFDRCTIEGNQASVEAGAVCCRLSAAPTFTSCVFENNLAAYRAGGLLADDESRPTVTLSTFHANAGNSGGGAYCCSQSIGSFVQCTFAANSGPAGGGGLTCGCQGVANLDACIIAASTSGEAIYCWSSGTATLRCSDLHGNAGGDWVGMIADQFGMNGNISQDPLFCDLAAGDLTLHAGSPCLAGHHPMGEDCGLIGAWTIGCPIEGIEDENGGSPLPVAFRLEPNFPNPFTATTAIRYRAESSVPPMDGDCSALAMLQVFDPTGRCVRAMPVPAPTSQVQAIVWNGTDDAGRRLPTGAYVCRLAWNGAATQRKLQLVR